MEFNYEKEFVDNNKTRFNFLEEEPGVLLKRKKSLRAISIGKAKKMIRKFA